MSIKSEELKRWQTLSRLNLSKEEEEEIAKEIQALKTLIEQLDEVEVCLEDGVVTAPVSLSELRVDEAKPSLSRESLLSCASERYESAFIVKRVVE